MNILILSCGTRNKVVQYFKDAVGPSGKVFATDCSPYAPALYDADSFYIVPRMTAPGYIDEILTICKSEHIDGVLSLIDPELSLLAQHKEAFEAVGATVVGSSYELCEMALDKWAMYNWLTVHGYRCAKTYVQFVAFEKALANGEVNFPVFVKPRFGSASLHISKADDLETAEFLFKHQPDMIIQEFLDGQEIGADVYTDIRSGQVAAIFTKEKLVMRAGETDKAISFKDEKLFALISCFVEESGYRAQIDMDIFKIGDEYYISEVNPRFGGGYPHAYECGVRTPQMIMNNLNGQTNMPTIGEYQSDVVMMKYNELKTLALDDRQ